MLPPTAPPSTVFTTDSLPADTRFDAWRDSISVLFDVVPHTRSCPTDFRASVAATHLGELLVGNLHFSGQQFSRSRARMARDGLDHYLVQWYRSGGFVGQLDDGRGDIHVHAGDIVVFDLQRSQHTHTQASDVVTLVLPRERMDEYLGASARQLHGTVLPTGAGLGGLLSDHMDSLLHRLPTLSAQDASTVTRINSQMLAACLGPALKQLTGSTSVGSALQASPEALLECIQRYIGHHLARPLSAESLCEAFDLSRGSLYRLFEPFEGVSRYIQSRRLQRAFHLLLSPANLRLGIAEIAARVGFASEAHFSRAFRAAFDQRPSDVRALSRHGGLTSAAHAQVSTEYAQWVRYLAV